nr:DUF885 family protein [Candidatus Eremiobacteraeota bacterium]
MRFNRIATLGLALLLVIPGAAKAAGSSDKALYAVADSYYREGFAMDPVDATDIGVHTYDAQLGSFTAAGFAERIARSHRALTSLRAIDPKTLSTEAGYDYKIFQSSLRGDLLRLETDQDWKHHPGFYTGTAAGAIYALIKRNFAPPEVRLRAVIAREEKIPAMLQDAAANITTVDATTAQIESADVKGSAEFFRQTVPQGFATVKDAALTARLLQANAAVIAAIGKYAAAMDAGPFAHPSGTYAIGPKEYEQRLTLQELTPIPLREYERVGLAALAQYKTQFIATARKIDATKTPRQVMNEIAAEHPAPEQLLPDAQKVLAQLRAFVVSHHIVTLPAAFDIKVVPTPVF